MPQAKIRERYRRLWALVAEAVARSDTSTAYDNSRFAGSHIVAQFSGGEIVGVPTWPVWVAQCLIFAMA